MTGLPRAAVLTGVATMAVSAWILWSRGGAGVVREQAPTPEVRSEDATASRSDGSRIVAPGRVEPRSEALEVSAEVSGRITSLHVEEGDHVAAGTVVVELERAEYEARVATARAALAGAEAEEARLINGARVEERREARFAAEQADAALAQAEREHRRRVDAADVIAREELDRAASDVAIARARQAAARERARVVDAPARADERARAQAQVNLARARLLEAEAMLAKTTVRAPIDGTVLQVTRRAGESVSVESPKGAHVVTLADVSVLRVRADVDERDVAHLVTGQRAYVTADAYGDRRFTGRVIRIGEMLGRKNIRSEEPTEKVDTKVLETLVELDPGQRLPIGLRVDTYILR